MIASGVAVAHDGSIAHGHIGALALPARQLVEKAVGEELQAKEADGFGRMLPVVGREAAFGIRIAAELNQIPNRQLGGNPVVLPEDRQAPGQNVRWRAGDIEPVDGHRSDIHWHQDQHDGDHPIMVDP